MNDDIEEINDSIQLSPYTESLLKSFKQALSLKRTIGDDQIDVSETASFFAFIYERARNAVEFSEEHLIRRFAISRILKRRLSVNPKAEGEGDNLIRELLWSKYVPKGSVSSQDSNEVQNIIVKYLELRGLAVNLGKVQNTPKLLEFIIDLASCEIEEYLFIDVAHRKLSLLYYLYQVTKNRIEIEGVSEEVKDSYYYVACETAYLKNDNAFIRYHLIVLSYGKISKLDSEQLKELAIEFKQTFKYIEKVLKNPYYEKLHRFVRKQIPAFLILYQVLIDSNNYQNDLLSNRKNLLGKVEKICTKKYRETKIKLKTAGLRSIIYIFLTKMMFVILLEVPLSKLIVGGVQLIPITVNTIFPPVLMGIIVTFVNPPSKGNTKRIYKSLVDIISRNPEAKIEKSLVIKRKNRKKRPILFALFSIMYIVVFALTFWAIFTFLRFLQFNLISIAIFIFFISVVSFFGYRVRQIAREYALEVKENIFSPFIDTFFLPILSLGKVFSNELAKLNIFMYIFDVLIEAPFKYIVDVIEEWISFTKARKEEIM